MHNIARAHLRKYNKIEREHLLNVVIKQVILVYNPLAIYAIGSILTENFDEVSDIDLVVIFQSAKEALNSWRLRSKIRPFIPCSLDIISFDIEIFNYKKNIGGIAFIAISEGICVYNMVAL